MKALFQLPDKPDILDEEEIIRLTGYAIPSAQVRWLQEGKWLFEKNHSGAPIVSRLYFQMRMAGIDAAAFLPENPWEPDFNQL